MLTDITDITYRSRSTLVPALQVSAWVALGYRILWWTLRPWIWAGKCRPYPWALLEWSGHGGAPEPAA